MGSQVIWPKRYVLPIKIAFPIYGKLSQIIARRKIAMLPKETSTYTKINVNLIGPPLTVNGQHHVKALHEHLSLL